MHTTALYAIIFICAYMKDRIECSKEIGMSLFSLPSSSSMSVQTSMNCRYSVKSEPVAGKDYLFDQNAHIWRRIQEYVKSILPNDICTAISMEYGLERVIDLDMNLDYILNIFLYPGRYKNLVVISTGSNHLEKEEKLKKFFLIISKFEDANIHIETFVFYRLEGFQEVDSSFISLRSARIEQVKIVFHNSSIAYCNSIGEFFIRNFLSGVTEIIWTREDFEIFGAIKPCILNSVVEVKLKSIYNTNQYNILRNMRHLYVLWIYESSMYLQNPKSLQEGNSLPIKNIYVPIETLEKYNILTDPAFVVLESLSIVMSEIKVLESSLSISKIVLQINNVLDTVLPPSIKFVFCNTTTLTTTILSGIMAIICDSDMHEKNIGIYIVNMQPDHIRYPSMLQAPFYYYAGRKEDKEKLAKCNVIVKPGRNMSAIFMMPISAIETYSKSEVDFRVENCTLIVERQQFIYLARLPKEMWSSEYKRINCLKFLCVLSQIQDALCMHCRHSIIGSTNTKSGVHHSSKKIMIYPCGHVCCALCGYRHLSQGFTAVPECRVCDRAMNVPTIYITYTGLIKRMHGIFLNDLDISICTTLDPVNSRFAFLYEPADSLILCDIATLFIDKGTIPYKWGKLSIVGGFFNILRVQAREPVWVKIWTNPFKEKIYIESLVVTPEEPFVNVIVILCKEQKNDKRIDPGMGGRPCLLRGDLLYIELFPNIPKKGFLFLHPWANGKNNKFKTLAVLEKNILLGDKIERIVDLCISFWNNSMW